MRFRPRLFPDLFVAANMLLSFALAWQLGRVQAERNDALASLAQVLDESERVERQATECATFNEGILLKWRTPSPLPTRPPAAVLVDVPMPDGRIGVEMD